MPRPIHFEIHAENPERAQRFYRELFGWTFQGFEGSMPTGSWTREATARGSTAA